MAGPVTLNLAATSVAAWYPTLYYSIDGGGEVRDDQATYALTPDNQYRVGTLPLQITKEGTTRIDFTSVIWKSSTTCVAEEGGVNGYHTVYVRIDGKGPEVTSDVRPEYADSAAVKLTAIDHGSGLDAFKVQLDNEDTVTVPVDAPTEVWTVNAGIGEHEIVYWAQDKLGRTSEGSVTFAVKQAPSVSLAAPATVAYNGKPKFTGTVSAGGGGLAEHKVLIENLVGSSWVQVAETTTSAEGTYTVEGPALTAARKFRAVAVGDETYATVTSPQNPIVKPYAAVGTPVAPSYVYRGRAFTVWGVLKPRHSSSTVRIYRERYDNGRDRPYGSYINARGYNSSSYPTYTKYSVKISLPYACRWRVRAWHSDSDHAPTYSAKWDYITVRR